MSPCLCCKSSLQLLLAVEAQSAAEPASEPVPTQPAVEEQPTAEVASAPVPAQAVAEEQSIAVAAPFRVQITVPESLPVLGAYLRHGNVEFLDRDHKIFRCDLLGVDKMHARKKLLM